MAAARLAGGGRACLRSGDEPGSSLLPGGFAGSARARSVRSLPVAARTGGSLAGKCQPLLSQAQRVRVLGEAELHQSKQLLGILSFETKNRAYK